MLIERLGGKSPVERLTCGDVLTNFGFQVAGEPLYHALIRETVPGCIDGFTALLGRFGKATLGVWVARDLERAATEPECLPRLIGLLENFPHRDAIGPLIEVMEKQRAWAVRIDRILSELLGVGSHTAGEWREIWAGMRDSVTVDLGTGWIGRRSTRR